MHFRSRIDDLLACTAPVDSHAAPGPPIIVAGGGKSAQECARSITHSDYRLTNSCASSAAFLAREGLPVTMIFNTVDAFLASPTPLPPYIRKSRSHDQIVLTVTLILTIVSGFYQYCPPIGSYVPAWSEVASLLYCPATPSDTCQALLSHNLAGRRYCVLFLECPGQVLGKRNRSYETLQRFSPPTIVLRSGRLEQLPTSSYPFVVLEHTHKRRGDP